MEMTAGLHSIRKLDPFTLIVYYVTFSFIGWCFETVSVLIQTGHLYGLGLFFIRQPLGVYFSFLRGIPLAENIPAMFGLPIIEMYGLGGSAIVVLFSSLRHRPIRLFLYSAILLTLFELGSSYFCDAFLHRSYWNYAGDFLNFEGRICLRASLAWGLLSLITIEWLVPKLDPLCEKIRRIRHIRPILCALFFSMFALRVAVILTYR